MRAIRAALVAIGAAMMAFGAVSAVTSHGFKPFRHIEFLVVALIAHDGFLLPLFLLIGFAVHRFVPGRYRGVVQGALIMTAAVTIIAIPFVLGKGRIGDNPSALPRNYPGGYAIVLGAIWLGAALLLLLTRRTRRVDLGVFAASNDENPTSNPGSTPAAGTGGELQNPDGERIGGDPGLVGP